MELIFLKILNMNLSASIVIAVVLLARFCLRKAPKKWSYLLWCVAGFRLCCPISLKTAFSLFYFAPFSSTSAGNGQKLVIDYFPRDTASLVSPDIYYFSYGSQRAAVQQVSPVAPEVSPAAPMLQTWLIAGMVLWCVGMAVLLIYGLVSYIQMRRALADAVLVRENIYETDRVRSPFILGVFRPKIFLPAGLNGDILSYVLAHEQYHIKRKDYLVKIFAFLLLSVHWFNPLVWLAFYLMGRDMEMSCDEKVLTGKDGIAKSYSMALLSFAVNRRFPAPSPLAFGETSVKSRIKNVLSWKRPRTWASLAAALFCIVVVAACGTNPSKDAVEIPSQPENSVTQIAETSSNQPASSSPEPLRTLTLEELVRMTLEAEGDLRWEDFDGFSYRDESSPPFLRRRYDIDEVYSVLVSGSQEVGEYLSGAPAYIYLYYGPYDCNRINVRWIGAGYVEEDFSGLSEEEIIEFFVSEIRGSAEYILPVNVIREFPFLFVGDAYGSIHALEYCGEHYYDITAYTEYGNIGGGGSIINPLDERVHSLGPYTLRRAPGSTAFLLFDVETLPDEITVRCWPDGSWGDLENEGEIVPVAYQEYYYFSLKDGSYIYDIEASWDHRGMPENYWWTMHYIFIGDTTPNPKAELINVLNSDGPYATAALDMLLDSLMDSPVETLESIGARPAGIRDWLCWSLAAHVDGMALDTDAPLSVSGLSENGAAARDKIVEYIADRNEPPKQWRQVYLDYITETLLPQVKLKEIQAVELVDLEFDGVPELLVWNSDYQGEFYYNDGIEAVPTQLAQFRLQIIGSEPQEIANAKGALFLLKSRESGSYVWLVRYDATEWLSMMPTLPTDWETLMHQYEVLPYDHVQNSLLATNGNIDAESINRLLNSWRPVI